MEELSDHLMATESIAVPLAEFIWDYARSGGPGGQNVNKVSSKAILRWHVAASPSLAAHVKERFLRLQKNRITTEGELVLPSQRYRDRERNREDCLLKLKEMIAEAATLPKPRKATKPTRGSKRRRLEDKKHHSTNKSLRKKVAGEE